MQFSKTAGFILILVIVVLITVVLASTSKKQPNAPVRKDLRIIAFGDSLVVGQGATSGKDFVSLLSGRLGVPIENAGRGGDTTESAQLRLQTEVLAKKPDVVILLLGGNDALRRMPAVNTFANLSSMIDTIQASGAKVLLLGVRGNLLQDTFADRFKKLAADKNVAFVPNVLDGLFGNNEFMSDTIHPNDKGYEKIADKVESKLRELLAK